MVPQGTDQVTVVATDASFPPIKRISPSRFLGFKQCALREVWRAAGSPPLLSKGPGGWLGLAIHSLLERSGKGEIENSAAISSCWDSIVADTEGLMMVSRLERHLVPLSRTAPNFEVRKRLAHLLAKSLLAPGLYSTGQDGKRGIEVWLETSDGAVGGRVDKILVTGEDVTIIDFKSGLVTENSSATTGVKMEYEVQLKLYAALYREVAGRLPTRLHVVGLDGKSHEVKFSTGECEALLQDARDILGRTNAIISSAVSAEEKRRALARPSADACRYCEYRPGCSSYLAELECKGRRNDWPLDVYGVASEYRTLGNGCIALKVRGATGDGMTVRGLHPDRHTSLLDRPQHLGIFSLSRDIVESSLVEGPLTTAYAL